MDWSPDEKDKLQHWNVRHKLKEVIWVLNAQKKGGRKRLSYRCPYTNFGGHWILWKI